MSASRGCVEVRYCNTGTYLYIFIIYIIMIIIYPSNIVVRGSDSLRYSSQTIKLCKQHVLEKHGRWGDQSQPKGFDRHILEAWSPVLPPQQLLGLMGPSHLFLKSFS